MKKMKAYGNRIMLKVIDREKERLEKLSLMLPDGREGEKDLAKVISVGKYVTEVKEGDVVILTRHAPSEVDGYLFAVEEDILAKVE